MKHVNSGLVEQHPITGYLVHSVPEEGAPSLVAVFPLRDRADEYVEAQNLRIARRQRDEARWIHYHFKTGRPYTGSGQEIYIEAHEEWCAFYDASRMVSGIIRGEFVVEPSDSRFNYVSLERKVIVGYDNMLYDYDRTEQETAAIAFCQRRFHDDEE